MDIRGLRPGRRARLRALVALGVAGLSCVTVAGAGGQVASAAAPTPPPNTPYMSYPSGCRPTAAHPYPVVLLHGTFANDDEDTSGYFPGTAIGVPPSFATIQGTLGALGYCTYSLTYGAYPSLTFFGGLMPEAQSAQQIASFIQFVLATTGAPKVDIVGHSEGGLMSLYTPKAVPAIDGDIHDVVAVAPPTHGVEGPLVGTLALLAGGQANLMKIEDTVGLPAVAGEEVGGAAINFLDDGPIAQPGIDYTVITSQDDELVTTTPTPFVEEPGVTNEYVQSFCPDDFSGHIEEAYDPNVQRLIEHALDPSVPVPSGLADCVPIPFLG